MTTTKTSAKADKAPGTPGKDAVSNYLEALTEGHAKLTAALKEARTRGVRVNDELLDSVLAGQRHAIDLGKRLTLNPTDFAANIKAVLEAATAAQGRALEIAKLMYREQSDVNSELRKMFAQAFDASRDVGENARKLAGFWFKTN